MIPRNIIVTAQKRPEAWLDQLAQNNPLHTICYFDDKAARDLIVEHFPGETVLAFDKVKPGAYRADLFRYCALQLMGGIYSDSLIPYSMPFSEMWDLDQDRVYLVCDKNMHAIQVGTMACNRNSRFMQLCQQRATHNICAGYYGDSPLGISGPEMAWRCFNEYTGESQPMAGKTYSALENDDPPVEIKYKIERTSGNYRQEVAEAVFVNTEKEVLFPYKLNRFRKHRKDKSYYWKAWHQRTVYGEKTGIFRRLVRKFKHFIDSR